MILEMGGIFRLRSPQGRNIPPEVNGSLHDLYPVRYDSCAGRDGKILSNVSKVDIATNLLTESSYKQQNEGGFDFGDVF